MASAGIVNIRKDARGDAHYRYKMPALQIKPEGKGNGVKTVLINMTDIARALSRPPTYPTKFFGCELGAQTTFDEKADRYIVNGTHDAARLRELLDVFIDKFVLCTGCKNPETDLNILKDETILRDCKACGERAPVDMRHKLVTFILKNPPKKAKKSKKPTGENGENGENGAAGEEGGDGDDSDNDFMSRKIAEGAADLAKVKTVDADTVNWSTDTSKEAQAARMESLNAGLQGAILADDDEEAGGPYDAFKNWVTDNRATASDAEIYKKAAEMGIEKKHRTVQALVESLFTEEIVKEVESHKAVFLKLTTSEKHQKSLLGGIERFLGIIHPDMIPLTPKVLMAFYQAEILEEEPALHFGKNVSKKYVDKDTSKKVRRAAQPFIQWLEAQESDDDDEEDEE